MDDSFNHCFVCGIKQKDMTKNNRVNLLVCPTCSGSENEMKAVNELMEGLAEGFVCGCI
jgi:uncharacterized CHY-type Zn-finger protein